MSQRKYSADTDRLTDGDSGLDNLSRRLIHRAARHTPDSLPQRMQEEWLADMAARTSALSRLRFAIGCCWATIVIAYQRPLVKMPVGVAVVAHPNLVRFSRRSSTLFLVVSLHAAVFYGVVSTLSHTRPSAPPPAPLQTREVPVARLRELLPRLDPQMAQVTLDVQRPELDLHYAPDLSDVAAKIVEEPSHPETPPPSTEPPAHPVRQVQGGPGAGFPDPDDFYPTLSRNLEEQGVVTVKVCVAANGRLAADPALIQGTGRTRLDEAALKLAKAGSGHYRATTEDGRPVDSCYPLNIRFRLKS
jgi:TonB family protein